MYRIHRAVHWAPLDALIRSLAPAAWFRQGVGITVTGSGVSQWDDQSGNGRHLLQGTDAARPALQGDGTILFNGTSHYLKCNAFTLDQPEWVVWVGTQVTWTANDSLIDGNVIDTLRLQQQAAGGFPKIAAYAGETLGVMVPDLAVGTVGVVSVVANGASSSIGLNMNSVVTGNIGAGNMGGITLGASGSNNLFSNIAAYELIVFPIAPTAAQRARIVAGLMARHGVA